MSRSIVPYEEWHGEALAKRLHPANIDEIWALCHLTGEEGIKQSVDMSSKVFTGLDDTGQPLAIFGVRENDMMGTIGNPWLVCREDIADYAFVFLKTFKRAIRAMQEAYDILSGEIDARNIEVLNMCRWVGFEIEEARPLGIEGLPFNRIVLKRSDS